MNRPPFIAKRLAVARAFSGLTLKQLADAVGVSPPLLSLYENDRKRPSEDVLAALAQALNVRPAFFASEVADPWLLEECSFRHRTTTPENLKHRMRAMGSLLSEVVAVVRFLGVKFPQLDVPAIKCRTVEDVEAAAEKCRVEWGYGIAAPLLQLGRVVEHHGVILVRHEAWSEKIDAFSRRGIATVIALNTARQSVSRSLFDIAHELGHLVMHDVATGSAEQEYQANWFAGAFMIPKRQFSREFSATRRFSWENVFEMKQRWGTSASAIIRRAYNLELIDPITYRQCYKYLSARGWTKGEPMEHAASLIQPELLVEAFAQLQSIGHTSADIAERLNITPHLLHALTGIETPVVPVLVDPAKILSGPSPTSA